MEVQEDDMEVQEEAVWLRRTEPILDPSGNEPFHAGNCYLHHAVFY